MGKYNHGLNGLGWTKRIISIQYKNFTPMQFIYIRDSTEERYTVQVPFDKLRVNLQGTMIAALLPGK
jgi:hypothetical protein